MRSSLTRLLWDQLGYSARDLWRGRIAFIFTFLFPLTFLLVIGALVGNATITPDSQISVMQFVTPTVAVMGALFGAYPTVAASLADVRERGVLKRVHGTPLPGWVYLAGRVGAAVLLALGSLTLMLVIGVVAYGVQIQWHTMPATVVTVLAAVTAFAATGVAVAGLSPSGSVAEAASIATTVVLSWLSGVMGYGDMPGWADRIAQFFPLKPFKDALEEQFDPFATGNGWDVGALALILGWAAGAVAVAVVTFRWEPVPAKARPSASTTSASEAASSGWTALEAAEAGQRTRLALLVDQARWATTAALRQTAWVFFAIAFPVAQYLFIAALMGDAASRGNPPIGLQSAAGMMAWAAIVTAMVFVPDAIVRAREQKTLKRLGGTPLPLGVYFAGRFVSALLLVVATAGLILLVGSMWFHLRVAWVGMPLALGVLVLGTATLGSCGLLLAAVLPSSKALNAVALGLAIPLSFFSDVFAVGVVPRWMSALGSVFPLKHLANSMTFALDPAGPTISWSAVGIMTAWLVVTGLLAARFFHWDPRA